MEQMFQSESEFHHFQLVNSEGDVPVSISVLVHYNQTNRQAELLEDPISTDEVIDFHNALQRFDGDFIKAFSHS